METKLLVLKLFLGALGIDDSIETVDDRKRVQKAVYLGQLSGIDLGYRYGWYRMGPYPCPWELRLPALLLRGLENLPW